MWTLKVIVFFYFADNICTRAFSDENKCCILIIKSDILITNEQMDIDIKSDLMRMFSIHSGIT